MVVAINYICRDHEFDKSSARKGKPKRKSGTVHSSFQIASGVKGVGQFHRINESKIFAHKRDNLELD